MGTLRDPMTQRRKQSTMRNPKQWDPASTKSMFDAALPPLPTSDRIREWRTFIAAMVEIGALTPKQAKEAEKL